MEVKGGTSESIEAATRNVCESGVMDGKKFTLIVANNLAPCTPVENLVTYYNAGKTYGRY